MDSQIRVRVPAKVNLALLVGGTRQDGYHELGTIFLAVSIFDEITAELAEPGRFEVQVSGLDAETLPRDDRNLAVRAGRLLAERHHIASGVRLGIEKQIPVAGGMAGGSADAAGALLACARLFGLELNAAELGGLARELGADVPFALLGGAAAGLGRGDQLTPVPVAGRLHWVFATSRAGLSTPRVFARFDELCVPGATDLPGPLLSALAAGDLAGVATGLVNDLAEPALDLRPELGEVLSAGRRAGALGALISGSGPTCAFLVAGAEEGAQVAAALSQLTQVRRVCSAWGPVPGAQLVPDGGAATR